MTLQCFSPLLWVGRIRSGPDNVAVMLFSLRAKFPRFWDGMTGTESHSFSSLEPGFWLCLCGSWRSSLRWVWRPGRKGTVWWITPMELMLCTLGLCCWVSFVSLSALEQSHPLEQRVMALPGLSTGSGCDTRVGGMYPPHFADVVLHFVHGISA